MAQPHPLYTKFRTKAQKARQSGDLEAGERYLLAAAGVAAEKCPDFVPEVTNELAYVYAGSERWDEAIALYRQMGAEDQVARTLERRGDYEAAEEVRRALLARHEQEPGPHLHDLRQSMHDLAALLHTVGRYDEAETLLKRLIALHEEHQGRVRGAPTATPPESDPDGESTWVSPPFQKLARVYEDQGRYAHALPLIRQALERTPEVGLMAHLAWLYEITDDLEEAEAATLQSLEMLDEKQGEPMAATFLHALGAIAEQRGDEGEAEAMYREVLDSSLGEHPQSGAAIRADLGRVLHKQHEHEEAEALLRDVLAAPHLLSPLELAMAMEVRARVLRKLDRPEDAEAEAREAEAVIRAWEGGEFEASPEVISPMDWWAHRLARVGHETLAVRVKAIASALRSQAMAQMAD
ncbi:MAG: tetratricopeptide repeat protein [Armatimonadetes bacterium]|nr:tetratricopeptide repeat protein [Armatimonadota bacterium]